MATRIQNRRGTASAWTTANPILAAGELGVETDTKKFKFGDGVTAWTSLAYGAGSAASGVTGGAAWLTGTSYSAGAVVTQGGVNYESTVLHTSGTFATDLAAGKWIETGVNSAAAVALSNATPLAASGSGTAGTGSAGSRNDHVHPAAGALPYALNHTGNIRTVEPFTDNNWAAPTLNLLLCTPLIVPSAETWVAIGTNVNVLAASSTVRVGVYADTGDGYPGALITDFGTLDTSTTGDKWLTISQAFASARLVWLAAVSQGGTATVRQINVKPALMPFYNWAQSPSIGWNTTGIAFQQASVTGALPANFTSTPNVSGGVIHRLFIRT